MIAAEAPLTTEQSIDLTRLPSIPSSDTSKKNEDTTKATIEYSSREVSPPALLIQQLLQAHYVFGLHHGPSLDELFVRLPRSSFCSTLERYWARFCRGWDVLLHGSPAVDVFGGLKLASGGELGYGVGEEEWGSGEREVLEDLTRRTEGLEDAIVARFGDPPTAEEKAQIKADEAEPWMGNATHPGAPDGVVFSGSGVLQRHSIRDLSLWMRQIYRYGEYAYGVRDNPLRERRKRKRRAPEIDRPSNGGQKTPEPKSPNHDKRQVLRAVQDEAGTEQEDAPDGTSPDISLPVDNRPELHPRVASHDHAATPEETPTTPVDGSKPNIPPPIVTAAERALKNATRNADTSAFKDVDNKAGNSDDAGTTLGIPDQYMKYLTFGLSTLGKTNVKRPSVSRQSSASIASKARPPPKPREKKGAIQEDRDDEAVMASLDPIPDGETLRARLAKQIQQEEKGHFLIGLRGDLDSSADDEEADFTDGSVRNEPGGSRIILRTIQVETTERSNDNPEERRGSLSVEGSNDAAANRLRRLRVLIYVHRPFIYCFLFEKNTSSLQYAEFYRSLHQILSPIRKALLSSTDATKIAQRIESSHVNNASQTDGEKASDTTRNTLPSKGASNSPIFDLIWDPRLLTVHTSIPNIPVPGTPAAEGIFTSLTGRGGADVPSWNRLEALNVHSQVLNTLQSVKNRKNDIERSSKTSRGWWIIWMKVPPSAPALTTNDADSQSPAESVATLRSDQHVAISGGNMAVKEVPQEQPDMHRIAFLVRKASDAPVAAKTSASSSKAVSSLFGNMSLSGWRSEDPTGGSGAGWGPGALAGGIGVDARRYVEGLLSLNR